MLGRTIRCLLQRCLEILLGIVGLPQGCRKILSCWDALRRCTG